MWNQNGNGVDLFSYTVGNGLTDLEHIFFWRNNKTVLHGDCIHTAKLTSITNGRLIQLITLKKMHTRLKFTSCYSLSILKTRGNTCRNAKIVYWYTNISQFGWFRSQSEILGGEVNSGYIALELCFIGFEHRTQSSVFWQMAQHFSHNFLAFLF